MSERGGEDVYTTREREGRGVEVGRDRDRETLFLVVCNDVQLQLFVQDTRGDQLAVSLPQEVSLREWHDVRVSQQGGNMTLTLDGDLKQQALLVLPSPLRTTSPLYIGGLPSKTLSCTFVVSFASHSCPRLLA